MSERRKACRGAEEQGSRGAREREVIRGKGVVKGVVEGEALLFQEAFSFLGDVDMDTSEIIAKGHEHEGVHIAGKVMIFPETKGSSGGCVVLSVLKKQDRQPAAIVVLKMADYNLVEGAILSKVPVICLPERDPRECIATGDLVRVDGAEGTIVWERRET